MLASIDLTAIEEKEMNNCFDGLREYFSSWNFYQDAGIKVTAPSGNPCTINEIHTGKKKKNYVM